MFKTRKELATEELARRYKSQEYQNDPSRWLRERFEDNEDILYWDKHPGYEDHDWDGTKNPFGTAFKAIANGRWCGIEAATGVGKTFWLPRVAFWFLDCFPDAMVITTAPKLDQLKNVLWKEMKKAYPKFKKIRPSAQMYSLKLSVEGRKKTDDDLDVGWGAIGIVAGVGAGEESATKMQGFHNKHMLFIIDELAGIHPSVLTAIINTCSNPETNIICGVGNPDSVLDALHVFCNLSHTEHIIISALDHPNVVNDANIIPGAVTNASIQIRKDEYQEGSPFYNSRVRGIAPSEASGALIKASWVDQCCVNHESFMDITHDLRDSENAVGVDVANSKNGDPGVVCWGEGNKCIGLHRFQCDNANHLAYNLIMDSPDLISNNYTDYGTINVNDFGIEDAQIGIDAGGLGVATINALKDQGYNCIGLQGGELKEVIATTLEGEQLYHFSALRSQMYFEARNDLQLGKVIIDINNNRLLRQLKKELITPLLEGRLGKIHVESKEKLKKRLGGKSTDLADAFVYWNWMRKGYYESTPMLPFTTG